jgi:hypothetical protein
MSIVETLGMYGGMNLVEAKPVRVTYPLKFHRIRKFFGFETVRHKWEWNIGPDEVYVSQREGFIMARPETIQRIKEAAKCQS